MLHFDILTLFPGIFRSFLAESLIGKAVEHHLLMVELTDFREYGLGRHRQVDDEPYGGGPGMLLRIEPIARALEARMGYHRAQSRTVHRVLLTPQGQPFVQQKAREWSKTQDVLMLICGRYEGFDERVRHLVHEEVSGGDYICLGGEVVAMLIIETISRLAHGVIGNPDSSTTESFSQNLLEFPQYTRPAEFEGMKVPRLLLSGNHRKIEEWRKSKALERTGERRPDLTTTNIE